MSKPDANKDFDRECPTKVIEHLRGDGEHVKYHTLTSQLHIGFKNRPYAIIYVNTGEILVWRQEANYYGMLNPKLYSKEDIYIMAAVFIKKHYPNEGKKSSTGS